MIMVVLDGGIVQGIVSNDPTQLGQKVAVLDYDTDGIEVGTVAVPQPDGGIDRAFLSVDVVAATEPGIAAAIALELKKRGDV